MIVIDASVLLALMNPDEQGASLGRGSSGGHQPGPDHQLGQLPGGAGRRCTAAAVGSQATLARRARGARRAARGGGSVLVLLLLQLGDFAEVHGQRDGGGARRELGVEPNQVPFV